MERLQKFISGSGFASRRKAEELIREGKVKVNGKTVTEMGFKVEKGDTVTVGGKKIVPQKKVYIMLNKPRGYITAVSDDKGRRVVTDLIKDAGAKVFPVGRLDWDSEGLLILTSDGDFANRLIHPSGNVLKTYNAQLKKLPTEEELQALLKGVEIEDYVAKAEEVRIIKGDKEKPRVLISITGGKNRQVRKMFAAIGNEVIRLKRISIGNLKLGSIPPGGWRHLTGKEISNV